MLTITQLARQCGVSRTTVMYYEQQGLLSPAYRGDNGYRWYGDKELERLKAIAGYRRYGLSLVNIETLLNQRGESQTSILKAHFNQLEQEIQQLKSQQQAILALLQEPELLEQDMVTKARWVEIMQAAGFSENDMVKWHRKFEEMEPQEHQKFLESLGIAADEIARIRKL
ncbi:MerR family transcriptional regulator [Shewanella corallii]|uniref:MerR family transcriptional regulator n=2 Tax=Shewanella TaxID=22 RepID=A0ABT0N838_9GAMM|nr:MerR family transcriptional regulator [Shewanella corallii]MCL2914601.1 MerR family transcriptional regulator [Shewanella corallii]